MPRYILTVREITHSKYLVDAPGLAEAVHQFNENGPYHFYQESSKVIEDEVIMAELTDEEDDNAGGA